MNIYQTLSKEWSTHKKIKKSLIPYGNLIRNKTLEEIHGIEKALEIKNKIPIKKI